MGLKKLELSSFRALSQKFFSFTDSNLISGKNGSGKTTLLESIYFSIENKSFKTNNMNSFYPFEEDFFALKALFDDNSKLELSRKKSKALVRRISPKESILNDLCPFLINNFALNYLESSSENRRNFLDFYLFHVEQNYKKKYKNSKIHMVSLLDLILNLLQVCMDESLLKRVMLALYHSTVLKIPLECNIIYHFVAVAVAFAAVAFVAAAFGAAAFAAEPVFTITFIVV